MTGSATTTRPKPVSRPAPGRTHIRRIEADELYIVQSLAQRIWPNSYDGVIAPHQIDAMLAEIYALDTLEQDMEALGHVFWIISYAVPGEPPVDTGFASAYKDGSTLWIKKLYILPEYQGLGLGKALMHNALEHFAPATHLSLYVNKGNEKAIDYYKYNGLQVITEVPVRMGPFDFTDYIMTKAL
ncbi:MAG: hypothetical protein B7Z26_01610 [Asticcacaulis sp. 32-58-5]|nr:MAG: hypothetical protein B7Z26_01610 [Asticcacaulis sp. 32-58-5]